MTTRIVELRQGILKKNDELARGLRTRFEAAGVLVLNLVSSPGTGKTEFLQRTLSQLIGSGSKAAAHVGDLETDNDARRLAASGAPVRQINTHGICHLEAEMVSKHLDGWNLADLDYLFIENVGNRVCPSSYDLGEKIRVLESADEITDKVLLEADTAKRDQLIKEGYEIAAKDFSYIPLHQQALAWGVSKKVKLSQRADNQVLLYWATKQD